jgi:hypothetical protein
LRIREFSARLQGDIVKRLQLTDWPPLVAKVLSVVVGLTGVAVLLGYTLHVGYLKSVLIGLLKMSPATALLMVLSGLSLFCANEVRLRARQPRDQSGRTLLRVSVILAGFAGAFAAVRLLAYALNLRLWLDLLWFREAPEAGAPPRMAPATAKIFVLFGAALLLSSTRRFNRLVQALTLAGGLFAWLGFSHYLFGGEARFPFGHMAVHTAICFLLLFIGLSCSRPDMGIARQLISDTPGGLLTRRLVPATLILPFVLGWIRLWGQRQGWYGTEAGISLLALANVIVFGSLIWANAELLHRSDLESKDAERNAAAQLEKLDLLQHITPDRLGTAHDRRRRTSTTRGSYSGKVAKTARSARGPRSMRAFFCALSLDVLTGTVVPISRRGVPFWTICQMQ